MIPGLNDIFNSPSANPVAGNFRTIGDIFSRLANVAFLIAAFLMVFWFSWGVFQYIFSGGSKDGLAKARARITWAIIGFFITMLAFAISQFAQQIFPNSNPPVTSVSTPP